MVRDPWWWMFLVQILFLTLARSSIKIYNQFYCGTVCLRGETESSAIGSLYMAFHAKYEVTVAEAPTAIPQRLNRSDCAECCEDVCIHRLRDTFEIALNIMRDRCKRMCKTDRSIGGSGQKSRETLVRVTRLGRRTDESSSINCTKAMLFCPPILMF